MSSDDYDAGLGGFRDVFTTKESSVSTGRQATDAPHWPLIRLTRLWDVLNQAKNWNELCKWFINHAGSGRYQMYWKVPSGYTVLSGAHSPFDFGLSTSSPQLPAAWSVLPKVKFVRLAPGVVEKVARQAYLEGSNAKPPVWIDRFLGGLSVPDDVSMPGGLLYEALPVTVELHIASANPTATNAWEMMDVLATQVFVDDSVYDEIRQQLKDAPSAEDHADQSKTATASATTHPEAQRTPAVAASVDPLGDATNIDDPYELKGRSDGVYTLYLTAERCARNPAFKQELNSKIRREIAHKVFDQMLNEMAMGGEAESLIQKKLRQLFTAIRLNHALRLIDPEYDHNSGRAKHQCDEWPPAPGKAYLARPDQRRLKFVSAMLALIIGGTEQWLKFSSKLPAAGGTKQAALQQWLQDHGLTGTDELKTAFAVIAWSSAGGSIPTPPKYTKQSTSRVRADAERRASRCRA